MARPSPGASKTGHCGNGRGWRKLWRMVDHRQTLSRAAEDSAAAFLERAGLAVVERNVRFPHGEIDLVCRDGDVLVFVEVKCRQAHWGDDPAAAVSGLKRWRLTRLARHYLKWRRLGEPRCRFDVVAVTADGAAVLTVRHVRNAFEAVER